MLNNPAYIKNQKNNAQFFLKKFKWTKDQELFLKSIAEKGYLNTNLNKILEVFGKTKATDGDKNWVLGIAITSNKGRKQDLGIYCV